LTGFAVDDPAGPVNLRPLEGPDADVMARWAEDVEFCRAAGWTAGRSLAEYRRFHQGLIVSPPAQLIRLGVAQEGSLVGYVDLHGDESHRRELGFLIGDRARWGRGLGRSAAAAGLDYGFGRLDLAEIWAEAFDANRRSIRILQRLGMVETGRGDDGVFLDQPTYYRQFAITAKDW
jgi:RimJ/RimL family protein N-acetyltransferase